jgi:Zn-dependent peptidase ImmA (M78 family)
LTMQHLIRSLKRHGIGSRAMTEDDFYAICERERVRVEFWSERISFYMAVPEIDLRVIVLPKGKKGLRLLFAMFHELGHHFAHAGTEPTVAFETGSHSKDEAEADAVALIAILPFLTNEPPDNTKFGKQIHKDRQRLKFIYGM